MYFSLTFVHLHTLEYGFCHMIMAWHTTSPLSVDADSPSLNQSHTSRISRRTFLRSSPPWLQGKYWFFQVVARAIYGRYNFANSLAKADHKCAPWHDLLLYWCEYCLPSWAEPQNTNTTILPWLSPVIPRKNELDCRTVHHNILLFK